MFLLKNKLKTINETCKEIYKKRQVEVLGDFKIDWREILLNVKRKVYKL